MPPSPLPPRASWAIRGHPAASASAALLLVAAVTPPLAAAPVAVWRIKADLVGAAAEAPGTVGPALPGDTGIALAALAEHPRLRVSRALYHTALLRPAAARAIYDPGRLATLPDHEVIVIAPALAEALLAEPPARQIGRAADGSGALPALIATAAGRAGVDPVFLVRTARRESDFNPYAAASESSARGLFQFVEQTWLHAISRWGPRHGLRQEAAAIQILPGGRARAADPAAERSILRLRYDPELSARMAAEVAADNDLRLTRALGRRPSAGELYAAHLLGLEGAVRLIRSAYLRPAQSAAEVLPAAAARNRRLFYRGGAPRSTSELLRLLS